MPAPKSAIDIGSGAMVPPPCAALAMVPFSCAALIEEVPEFLNRENVTV